MRRLPFIICLLLVLLVACGDEDHFRVKGEVDGNATMNIRVGYYSQGAYQTLLTAARDGKFEFAGSAPEGAVVELYDHEYRLIGRFYGQNGTDYELGVVRRNPYAMTVKADGRGAAVSDRFSTFMKEAADSLVSSPNNIIARYIKANPSDVVSTILLITAYDSASDPLGADSLMESIEPQARPSTLTHGFRDLLRRVLNAYPLPDTMTYRDRKGSTDTFFLRKSPLTMFVADNRHNEREKVIVPFMRQLRKNYPEKRLRMIEVSLDNDTNEWKRSIALDTATWIQTWAPGSIGGPFADKLAIEGIPYFMVVDSAGTVLYRGPKLRDANETVVKTLSR